MAQATSPSFVSRLVDLYNGATLTKLIALGTRTGLLDTCAQGPGTSAEIAERVNLNERYVREWLAGMAAGGLLTYDPASGRYTLPPEHAPFLAGSTATNVAPMSRLIESLGTHLGELAACFREGGGVPYSAFRPEFTGVMDDVWRRIYDNQLIDGFLGAVPEITRRLEEGCRAADVGCGSGHAINLMADAYPRSTFAGFDVAEDAIAEAVEEASAMGLSNATFQVCDVTRLPTGSPFDLITAFDAIHDQVDPAGVLRRVHDALVPDGLFFMVDFDFSSNVEENLGNPFAGIYYGISLMHCMTVSLAAGGAGLGTVWGRQLAQSMLEEAGFQDVQVLKSPRPQNCIYVSRRP